MSLPNNAINYSHLSEGDINTSNSRKNWIRKLNPNNRVILEKDAELFIHQNMSTPCLDVISSCEGPYIITRDGRKILDFHGNNVHQVGYRNPAVIEAIKNQLDQLPFCPRRFTSEIAIDFSKKLLEKTPGNFSRLLYTTGGTTAVSLALKLARLKTGSHKVVSMWESFHGAGLDTISVGGEAVFRKDIGPLLPGTLQVPPPDTYRSLWDNDPEQDRYVDYIKYVFEHEGDVGALLAETIRNTNVQIPTLNFWKKIRDLCTEFGVVLILDEIPIALGRTGRFFAFENYAIIPDIIVMGKGLGGGVIPFAAILTTEEFNNVASHSVGHFTFEKSPMACAAGLAVINFIDQNGILDKVKDLEYDALEWCSRLYNSYNKVGDIRGLGLLWGIELVKDRETKERAISEAEQIMYYCLERGLNFKVSMGNVITLSPSLIISKEELYNAFYILDEAFHFVLNQ